MKFTLSWIKKYVDVDLPVSELAERLTMLGLEVDAVDELFGDMGNVVVARVDSVEKHPNADKLSICNVSVNQEVKRVVCGAPNVNAGMLTALALPGAKLPGGFKVKPTKIRGEYSEGMLCSAKELGISDDQSGIMELPDNLEVGQSLVKALDLLDTLIEVDLTPNRPDCTSVIGIAREVAGFTAKEINKPVPGPMKSTGSNSFSVEVKASDACPRYAAALLKNVTLAPSPWWLQRLLLAVGLRPINNVVDITNFVMLEYGQPLHAFDFKNLSGGKIIVRKADEGEKITTLDGIQRDLDSEMLLICDGEKPVAIAGIMGGENSEVNEGTTDILLESAYFDPISIRRTNRNLKLGTDASYRFERGIDPQGTIIALTRAAQLICEICGAELVDGAVDVCGEIKNPSPLKLRTSRVSDILGVKFSAEELGAFLNGIEIPAILLGDDALKVTPPSFRVDLEREVDLVEEIARLYGYNEIPTTLPVVPMSFSEQDKDRKINNQLAGVMTAIGYVEAINYSFSSPNHFDKLELSEHDIRRQTVNLLNPLTEEQGVMRTMLLPGMLENVRHNLNRQNSDVRLFEIGKVFYPEEGKELPNEIMKLTAVCTGRRYPGSSLLHFGDFGSDIYDVMGTVERLLKEVQIKHHEFAIIKNPAYSVPGEYVSIKCGSEVVGELGKIDRAVLKKFGIKQDLFFLDIDVSRLLGILPEPIVFRQLSKFPAVKWDLAVIVAESVGGGEIINEILASKKTYLENVEIFDIYRGTPIEKGYKSIAMKITYHSKEQTLDDELVGDIHQQVIDLLLTRFDAQLREI